MTQVNDQTPTTTGESGPLLPSPFQSPQLALASWKDAAQLAEYVAQSGYFDTKNKAQALMKIAIGIELGIGPLAAVRGVLIDDFGNISITANLQAALVQRSERYKYEIVKHDETQCVIEFFERSTRADTGWRSLGISTLTMAQAVKAGMNTQWSKKDNKLVEKITWRNYPRNMLFARALTNGVKWFAPAVTAGIPVYDPDEIQDVETSRHLASANPPAVIQPTSTTTTTTEAPIQAANPPVSSSSSSDKAETQTQKVETQNIADKPAAPPKRERTIEVARQTWVTWANKANDAKKKYPESAKRLEGVLTVNKMDKAETHPEIVFNQARLIMAATCDTTGEMREEF